MIKLLIKQFNLCCFLLLGNISFLFAQAEFDQAYNARRVENEYKLKVPDSIAEDVWLYLQQKYANENSFLSSIDSSFHATFSIEIFTDQYFDTENRDLQKKQNSVRHRIRKVITDSTDRKNNKQLIQVKLNSIDKNILNRAEYKFPVKYYSIQQDSLHNLPLLGMVKKEKRNELIALLNKQHIDAYSLLPAIKLIQTRRRVYISKNAVAFATLTLDGVKAELDHKNVYFTEIELELNEIAYTQADSVQRMVMEYINEKFKNDLITRFPSIIQDQTPKYNKAYAMLEHPTTQAQIHSTVPAIIKYIISIFIFILLALGFVQLRKYNS